MFSTIERVVRLIVRKREKEFSPREVDSDILTVLNRGRATLPIRLEELRQGTIKEETIPLLYRTSAELIAKPRWTREEALTLVHLAGALRLIQPKIYRQVVTEIQGRLEKALWNCEGPVDALVLSLAHLASPDPRTEQLLAMANLRRGVTTQILRRYPLSEEVVVDFHPELTDVVTSKQIEEEFREKRVLVVDPHGDDAPFFIGSLLTNVIAKVAKETIWVTVVLDPSGVTEKFASAFLRKQGRPLPKDQRGWTRLKKEIRLQAIKKVASKMKLKSIPLKGSVRLLSRHCDPTGELLSYYSAFTLPSSLISRKFLNLLSRFNPEALLLPLPKAHYHQTHRDVVRLALQALYKEYFAQTLPSSPALYFYSDGLHDLLKANGLRSNLIYFYGGSEEKKKLKLISSFPSQLARNPLYPHEVEAKDILVASFERARHPQLRNGKEGQKKMFAEQLLKISMVPWWNAKGWETGEMIHKAIVPLLGAQPSVEVHPYDPFGLLPGRYYAVREEGITSDQYLVRRDKGGVDALWRLPPNGIKPGHGLLVAEYLKVNEGDTLVDIGTGPLGFLGLLGAYRGAKSVFAIDINLDFVETSREGAAFIGFGGKVHVFYGDLFRPIGTQLINKAVIHPPMLPAALSRNNHRYKNYDEGGPTGREVLDCAIRQAAEHMLRGGELLIGQFEFLGVNEAFGEPPTTFEVLRRHGFKPRVEALFEIPITPTIQNHLSFIQPLYPRYPFAKRNGKLWHKFVVLSGEYTQGEIYSRKPRRTL